MYRILCRRAQFFVFFSCCFFNLSGQNWHIGGFVSEMPSYTLKNGMKSSFDNLIHNRIKINNRFKNGLLLNVEMRNRLFWGRSIKNDATQKYIIGSDPGAIDMSLNIGSGVSYVLNSHIDRINFTYNIRNVSITLGRQRVGWGLNKIWNANDLFNVYSYYDFDYEAKPSMDGLSLKIGNTDSGVLNAAIKVNSNQDYSGAIMYRKLFGACTMQVIAGLKDEEDYLIGCGYSFKNESYSIYGEASYFMPVKSLSSDVVVTAIGGRYFYEKFYVGFEYLYSNYLYEDRGDVDELIKGRISLKSISIVDHTYNLSLGAHLSSKFHSSIDFIGYGYPMFDGGYISVKSQYNILKSLSLSAIVQMYRQDWLPKKSKNLYLYLRLRKTF